MLPRLYVTQDNLDLYFNFKACSNDHTHKIHRNVFLAEAMSCGCQSTSGQAGQARRYQRLAEIYLSFVKHWQNKKQMVYLKTRSTHFTYSYMVRNHSDRERELTHCCYFMDYSFQLATCWVYMLQLICVIR